MNLITLLITVIFLYPILRGYLLKFSSNTLKRDIESISGSIAFLIAIFIGIYYAKIIFIQHESYVYSFVYNNISSSFLDYLDNNPQYIYIFIMPIFVFIFYRIIVTVFDFLSGLTLYPIIDSMEKRISKRSDIFKRILGSAFALPRSICYVITLAFILNILSMFNINPILNQSLENSASYKFLCKQIVIPVTNSTLAKQLPKIIDNSFKVVQKGNVSGEAGTASTGVTIYYNGVTLNEGIKSNAQIDKMARSICSGETPVESKAKLLYDWVGSNISYDYDKADRIFQNDTGIASGAIPAFETRKGICFDYSCLYVAMCRANGIKVRLITGEGFNGTNWVGHAWNQVYLPEQGSWINVDTTFYHGGNYFGSKRFNIDHRGAEIAGEW